MTSARSSANSRAIERALSALARIDRFRLSGLMCHVCAPQLRDGVFVRGRTSWSLHCEGREWFSHLEVHGSPQSAGVRAVVTRLQRAGYAVRARLPDEVLLHRGLRTVCDAVSELRLLEQCTDGVLPRRLPVRKAHLPAPPRAARTVAQLRELVSTVQASSAPWDTVLVRSSRRVRRRMSRETAVDLEVHADVCAGLTTRTKMFLAIRVMPIPGARRLPAEACRRLSTALTASGWDASTDRRFFIASQLYGGLAAGIRAAPHAFECANDLLHERA